MRVCVRASVRPYVKEVVVVRGTSFAPLTAFHHTQTIKNRDVNLKSVT